ncbi:MAG: DUF362 domain-containing protein [Eubacteriales bacterium]|nr:DUF362 domain-containing protein [Eubacteriales bacterium]
MEKNEILMIHGKDYKEMTKKILAAAGLAEQIGGRDKRIGLKPNLVVAKTPDSGATTHMEIVEGTVEYLQENGFFRIAVTEGSWVGERTAAAFRACGYPALAKKYGVELMDNQKDTFRSYDAAGMRLDICDFPMSLDFLINLPVLKGHCQTLVTCALKNNKGLIPNSEKRKFHTMGLHKPIAHLAAAVPNDFILVDNICGDLDFEEGGNPVQMDRILAFRDPVLCDAFVCETMGYRPDDVPYVRMAERLGVGSADTSKAKITELNESCGGAGKRSATRRVQELANYAEPKDACSACYGSLIYALDRLNDRGLLRKGGPKIAVGQGYQGKTGELGVGKCTKGFAKSCPGCPPRAVQIAKFLEKEWSV